jgi:hypothetical protein
MEENILQKLLADAATPEFLASTKVHESFMQRWIPLKHTGVPSRVFHSWKEAGIITGFGDSIDKERERTLLTIPEFIWTKTVQILRSFGVNYQQILVLKADFFVTLTPDEYLEIEVDRMNITDPAERAKTIQDLKAEVNLDVLIPPNEVNSAITHLTIMILHAQIDIAFRILQDGNSLIMLNGMYMYEDYVEHERKPYIYISLNQILFDLLADPAQADKIAYYELLTENELDVIKLMRSSQIRRLEIKFVEGEPFAMEWTEGSTVKDTELHNFISAVKMRPYSELIFKNNNNKTVYVEQVTKRRL